MVSYFTEQVRINKLSEGPPINLNDHEALLDLADDFESCELTLAVVGRLNQINNEDKMLKILRRVPPIYVLPGRKGARNQSRW